MKSLEGKNVDHDAPSITIDGLVSALPNKFIAEAYILNSICQSSMKKQGKLNDFDHHPIID